MSEAQQTLNDLERELTLLARHYLSGWQARPGQQLDRSAYVLLTRLESGDALSLKEIAKALGLDISTINRQVSALLKQGLIERFPDPDGGMARKLRPTELGLQRLSDDREHSRGGLAAVVDGWPEGELNEFLGLLTRFNQSTESYEGNAWPRP